jgi:hypothetical protein
MLIPFSPAPGLNSDDTTFSAEGRWADGNNVRFHNGKPQVIGGWIINAVSATSFSTARQVLSLGSSDYAVASSSAPKFQVDSGGTTYDITPASTGSGVSFFLRQWGSYLLIGQVNGTIYEWQGNTGVDAAALSNAPASIQCMTVTPQRQVLAGGATPVLGGTNLMCIRGSNLEDNNDWTPTASNNSFEDVLEGGGTRICAIENIGPYVGVWTDTAVWMGTFIGDPAQTYRWDMIAEDCGMLSNDASAGEAIVIAGTTAFWVSGDKRFWSWTIGGVPTSVPCPIGLDFRTNISTASGARCAGWHNFTFNEVWFFYQDTRDSGTLGTFTRYVALSLENGTWFRGQIGLRAVGRGIASDNFPRPYTIELAGGKIALHEGVGNQTAGGSALTWHIQSADQYFDESRRRALVRAVIPDFEDQSGDVSLTLTVRKRPQEAAVTKGPYTLTTATTKKDFRASGKLVTVKFSGSSTYMRLGKPLFDVVMMGEG